MAGRTAIQPRPTAPTLTWPRPISAPRPCWRRSTIARDRARAAHRPVADRVRRAFLAPQVLDYTVRGHVPERMGNRSLRAAPHGVFPSRAKDAWIAIACETDAQWQTLVQVMGSPAWATEPRSALDGGWSQDDARSGTWRSGRARKRRRPPAALAGGRRPAGVASPMLDVFEDPQLVHREHFVPLDHPEMGVGSTTNWASSSRFAVAAAHRRAAARATHRAGAEAVSRLLGCRVSGAGRRGRARSRRPWPTSTAAHFGTWRPSTPSWTRRHAAVGSGVVHTDARRGLDRARHDPAPGADR